MASSGSGGAHERREQVRGGERGRRPLPPERLRPAARLTPCPLLSPSARPRAYPGSLRPPGVRSPRPVSAKIPPIFEALAVGKVVFI